jgi:hypothetical protein
MSQLFNRCLLLLWSFCCCQFAVHAANLHIELSTTGAQPLIKQQPSTSGHAQGNSQSCAVGQVTLTANFEAGRMDQCKRVSATAFEIVLAPENTPINPSPWYAFSVQASQPTAISITMTVQNNDHRYPPKVSLDGKTWQAQAHTIQGQRLVMQLTASAQPKLIAAQEIINNQYYIDWAAQFSKHPRITQSILGYSTQGRPIYKIESRNQHAKEWLVILGRQHPPEITGAFGLLNFVETLFANNTLSEKYLAQFNVLVIPNLNPDGVYAGNWRHNANGVDLNRDWGNFLQVETKQVNQYLQQLVQQGQKIKFAIDFHSTKHDVFYTLPTAYGVENPLFVEHWLTGLDRQMPNFKVVMRRGNEPNSGVSKQYFADVFGVHAITYEMGDNTERTKIKQIAFEAASLLMRNMLADVELNKK